MVLTFLICILHLYTVSQFASENTMLRCCNAAKEKIGYLKSSCSAPAGGSCPMCGTPNGRKKLGVVGTWSEKSQSVENASAKLKQIPIWKFL